VLQSSHQLQLGVSTTSKGAEKKAMFQRKSLAQNERYVSGIFDNEKKPNK
jgi:hypothetical protein